MSDIIYLSNVRLSFPHLADPQRQINELTGKETLSYNCDFIMEPDSDNFSKFMKKYGELAVIKWQENASVIMNMIQSDRKLRCYGKGDEKINKKTLQPHPSHAGKVFIAASRKVMPQIIQSDGTPVDEGNTLQCQQILRKMYGGCRVNAAIKPWLQDNKHGRGVRCDLVAIQFSKDDTPFGEGAIDASGMFNVVAETHQTTKETEFALPPYLLGK